MGLSLFFNNTYISLFCQLRGPRSKDISITRNITSTQGLISSFILQEKGSGFLEKWLILQLQQEMCEIKLEHVGANGKNTQWDGFEQQNK